jgi:dihydroorotase
MLISGKLLYRGDIIEAGLRIEEGRIKEISKGIDGRKIKGLILPAAIDVHVHLRDFEERDKETIKSGSLSALHGGVCLVVDQPNTNPFIDSPAVFKRRVKEASKKSYVDYSLNLGLTSNNVANIRQIVNEIRSNFPIHAIGEIFLQHSDARYQVSYEELGKARSMTDVLLTVHAEDPAYVEGNDIPNFLFRKEMAELEAVRNVVKLGIHICHVSLYESLKLVHSSPSTAEVTPHHLLLSKEDFDRLKGFINVNPPLRSRGNAEMLLKNFNMFDILASDHAPHREEDKLRSASGFPGVETMYPLMMSLVRNHVIGLNDLVERIAINPAKIFGFRSYGEIEVGNFANLAVFDFSDVRIIRATELHSLCQWTPYEGFEAIFPHTVILRGELVLEGGEVLIEPGFGSVV